MKRIIKRVAIIIGIIIFILVIATIGIVVSAFMEFIEEGPTENKSSVKIEYQQPPQNPQKNYDDIPDEDYYPTVEEAMKHSDMSFEKAGEYQKNIDEIIAKFENENYVSVFYISIKDDKKICKSFSKFKIKEIGGIKKYVAVDCIFIGTTTENARYIGSSSYTLGGQLLLGDHMGQIGINPENKRFFWGSLCEQRMQKGESIKKMEIEGQKPDGIIEYKVFDKTWYFWYYEDLKSDKASRTFEYTLGKEEE